MRQKAKGEQTGREEREESETEEEFGTGNPLVTGPQTQGFRVLPPGEWLDVRSFQSSLQFRGSVGVWASSSVTSRVTSIRFPFGRLFELMKFELSVWRQAAQRWPWPETPAEDGQPRHMFCPGQSHWVPGSVPQGQWFSLHFSFVTPALCLSSRKVV